MRPQAPMLTSVSGAALGRMVSGLHLPPPLSIQPPPSPSLPGPALLGKHSLVAVIASAPKISQGDQFSAFQDNIFQAF